MGKGGVYRVKYAFFHCVVFFFPPCCLPLGWSQAGRVGLGGGSVERGWVGWGG